jgi:hypothetical protein
LEVADSTKSCKACRIFSCRTEQVGLYPHCLYKHYCLTAGLLPSAKNNINSKQIASRILKILQRFLSCAMLLLHKVDFALETASNGVGM